MRSLWIKLLGAFAVVTLVAAGIVAGAANRATSQQFDRYLQRGEQLQAQRIAALVAAYYDRLGGWPGVASRLGELSGMPGPGMMRRGGFQSPFAVRDRVFLADDQGVVVFDSSGEAVGQELSPRVLDAGVPITVDDQRVGTVLIDPGDRVAIGSLEGSFLARVNRWFLLAGLLAGILALVLGVYLAWQITAPLRELQRAAQAIAGGDLSRRVTVNSGDEIGDLARAFNQMGEALERDERLRHRMMADIAHELRTPLSVIRANVEALQDGVFPLARESLAPIHEETLLLARLVEDLRQLALADAGQLALERQSVDMAGLIQQAVESHRPQATEKGVQLTAEFQEPLPPISADPQRVAQVLRNLLANGLRYTPTGGQVTVGSWPFGVRHGQCLSERPLPAGLLPLSEGAWLAVSVSDTGPGIGPEDLPHIFERFYRGDPSRSRASGGTGLGLAIVRQLIEAHDGKVGVENAASSGARFVFVLPA